MKEISASIIVFAGAYLFATGAAHKHDVAFVVGIGIIVAGIAGWLRCIFARTGR